MEADIFCCIMLCASCSSACLPHNSLLVFPVLRFSSTLCQLFSVLLGCAYRKIPLRIKEKMQADTISWRYNFIAFEVLDWREQQKEQFWDNYLAEADKNVCIQYARLASRFSTDNMKNWNIYKRFEWGPRPQCIKKERKKLMLCLFVIKLLNDTCIRNCWICWTFYFGFFFPPSRFTCFSRINKHVISVATNAEDFMHRSNNKTRTEIFGRCA